MRTREINDELRSTRFKQKKLIARRIDDELLLFEEATSTAHCLNGIAGEMWMELEDGEVHLKPGDVVIQRGTLHNWNNRGQEPCVMAFILVATEGAKTTGWNEKH